MKRLKKLRLNTEKTTRLLSLGLDDGGTKQESELDVKKEHLLLDILQSKLPLDQVLESSLPPMIQSLTEELKSLSGSSLGELILEPKTSLELLQRIKDHAKQFGASAQGETEREVMLVVYYGAIAAALVYHDVKISEHSYKSLEISFAELISKRWISSSLNQLFMRARILSRKD